MTDTEVAIEEYADAWAELTWENDLGFGIAVGQAETRLTHAIERLRPLGFNVTNRPAKS